MALQSAGGMTDTPASPADAGGALLSDHIDVRLIGRLVDASYRIVVEVRLVDDAVGCRKFTNVGVGLIPRRGYLPRTARVPPGPVPFAGGSGCHGNLRAAHH